MTTNKIEEPSEESLKEFPEVDFSQWKKGNTRGRFANVQTANRSTHWVLLPEELWKYFGSDENVCEALTLLATTSQKWKRASGE